MTKIMTKKEALKKIQEIKNELVIITERDEMEWTDDPIEALKNLKDELDFVSS